MIKIPQLGLGTFRLSDQALSNSIQAGLEVGFRHIDTAQIYGNERQIGEILNKQSIDREDIFLTSKIWIDNLSKTNLLRSLKKSLQDLQTDYLDLTLIHWPSPNNQIPLKESLEELMSAKNLGLTKNIGVSNFTIEQLKEAISIVGKENIATNQIEVHPFLQNKKLVEFCNNHEIQITAYMPLAYGEVMKSEVLSSISKKHKVSNAEVSLSWLLDQNMIVIPSSTNPEHLNTNYNVRKGFLDAKDRLEISRLERNYRIANPDFSPNWD